ncbi:MAG: acyl-CoA dehydrogenase family protein [Chloroflexota bacterium]
MTISESLTGNDILAAARALAPQIRAAAEEIETGRRLPIWLVDQMKAAGIFRMPMPRAWGGPEVDPLTQIRIVEELSAANASVGWCAMIGSDGGFFVPFFEESVGRALYPDLDLVTGSSTRPTGRAEVVEGGYRVSGRWQFSSGCQHSAYLVANCMIFKDGVQQFMADGAPLTRLCYLRAEQAEILDTWTTTGLRGSGSHDFTATDQFVATEHTFNVLSSPMRRSEPLYRLPFLFIINGAGVPLGNARAAIDALVDLASSKQTLARTGLSSEPWVQIAVAKADTLLGGARGYVFDAVGEVWDMMQRGDPLTPRQRARFRLALSAASHMCVEAVDLMYQAGGGTSIYAGHPLDRIFRDAHTIHQHITSSPKVYQVAGQMLLGLEPELPQF